LTIRINANILVSGGQPPHTDADAELDENDDGPTD
jgi:hypothetical protein